jgi:hypothetical protein
MTAFNVMRVLDGGSKSSETLLRSYHKRLYRVTGQKKVLFT